MFWTTMLPWLKPSWKGSYILNPHCPTPRKWWIIMTGLKRSPSWILYGIPASILPWITWWPKTAYAKGWMEIRAWALLNLLTSWCRGTIFTGCIKTKAVNCKWEAATSGAILLRVPNWYGAKAAAKLLLLPARWLQKRMAASLENRRKGMYGWMLLKLRRTSFTSFG